ncbi:MAG: replication-relaxation family protein [Acidobacteriota bacterium]
MKDSESPPFDAVIAHAPGRLQPILRPVLRGIAIDEISRDDSESVDVGGTTLDTVANSSPPGNTRENTPENTAALVPGDVANGPSLANSVGPPRVRDAALLLLIVQLRIASIRQLAMAVFPDVSIVVARRRIRALQRDGWIRAWDRPVPSGGAPRYVYPTARALRWAFLRFLELARGGAAETVVRLMLPDSTKRLAQLAGGGEPQWFAHQDEINRLVLARRQAAGERMVWSSSWDCPFPDRLNGLKAPQPDYVLVTKDERGVPALIFGEHDRATEPIARWSEKLAAYSAAREVSGELFGHARFIVDVSVADPVGRNPWKRVRAIGEAARDAGCEAFVRLTLAGWLHARPEESIWFSGDAVPEKESLNPRHHANTRR